MGLLDFEKCCFCIDLRVGCLIIAYLNLVAQILCLIFAGTMAATGAALVIVNDNAPEEMLVNRDVGIMIIIFFAIVFLLVSLFLAFTIVLLVGIYKNKRGHVKAYLIYSIVFQVISIFMFLFFLTKSLEALDVIKNAIMIILDLYFLLVIRRYYNKMEENSTIIAPNKV